MIRRLRCLVLRIYSQAKYCPPFAVRVEPVISPASSEARNTTQRAISSGSPRRPIGISRQYAFLQHVLRHRLHHLGVDVARADGIDGDARARALLRQRLGEAELAGFGGGIVHLAELALLAVDRRDIDDAAELALAHALDHVAAHVEQRIEIGVDHRRPLLGLHPMQLRIAGDAGIVDQHVDRSEIGHDLFDAG